MAYFEATVIGNTHSSTEQWAMFSQISCYFAPTGTWLLDSFTASAFNDTINNDPCNMAGGIPCVIQEATITDLGNGTSSYYIRTTDLPSGFTMQNIIGVFPNIFIINQDSDSLTFYFQYVDDTPSDLTICDECRNITLQACSDSYKIVAGLTPATNYFVTIQDRNNDLYIQEITSDGNGDVTIDATSPEFPAGFWLTESGNKVIKIYSDEALTEIEDITVDTTVYSCVLLNLQYYYTTTT
jgi:hypothetical protein